MERSPEQEIAAFFDADLPGKLGVAVSGGSDSLALLLLLSRFCKERAVDLWCVTVDHGLRAEAAEEARFVAAICADLGVPHDTLAWTGWDGSGNVQNEARRARYDLIAGWATEKGISHVALGHTLDDQAETVLQRLARAAGVDGLSAMAPRRVQNNVTWLRPVLRLEREMLRAFLRERNVSWLDDPSNEDVRFGRIKARRSWEALAEMGITPAALAQVAENMARAREALEDSTRRACMECARLRAGAVVISRRDYDRMPDEIARRIVLAALAWVNGAIYAPRRRSLEAALSALAENGSATLDGCQLQVVARDMWIFREFNVVKDLSVPIGSLWDGRWVLSGPSEARDMRVAALGEAGLVSLPEWRDLGVPRQALLSTPAVWKDGNLVAAPVIAPHAGWKFELKKRNLSIFDAVFTH